MSKGQLLKRIRIVLMFFMIATMLSGITAFPLEWELRLLAKWLGADSGSTPDFMMGLAHWVVLVRDSLIDTYSQYPFMAYGTDWLAFGHIVIALAFVGAVRDPIKNRWIIEWAMLACILVIPTALIFGQIRGIPFYWRLIDCAFGVFGIIPLWLTRRYVLRLEHWD